MRIWRGTAAFLGLMLVLGIGRAGAVPVPGIEVAPSATVDAVTPARPRIAEVVRRGNCSGPPSPGEQIVVRSSVTYRSAIERELRWGLGFVDGTGRPSRWVANPRTERRVDITGRGRIERTERFTIRDGGRAVTAPVRITGWAAFGRRAAVSSAPAALRLGSTLVVQAVDARSGAGIDAAVTVMNGRCLRSRGTTWTDSVGPKAAFFHLAPGRRAEVFVTAQGYAPVRRTVTGLKGARTRSVRVAMEPGVDMAALRQQAEDLVNAYGGWNAVTITDLQTGQSLSINGDRAQPAACTIKIFILMAIAEDIAAGKYTAESVASLVYSAMGPSATPPARELIRIAGDGDIGAGINRIHDIMTRLGMTASIMRHPPGYHWEVYDLGDGENLLTTDELNVALGKIYRRQALGSSATDYLLWSMTLATPFLDGSLGGPLPPEATLYHKIGLIGPDYNTWNDAGIVTFERDGRRYAYAISLLSSYTGSYHEGYLLGYQLSRVAWMAFSSHYQ